MFLQIVSVKNPEKKKKNNIEEKIKKIKRDRFMQPNYKLKKSDIKNSSESNPVNYELTNKTTITFHFN